jgi:hypothetical protein
MITGTGDLNLTYYQRHDYQKRVAGGGWRGTGRRLAPVGGWDQMITDSGNLAIRGGQTISAMIIRNRGVWRAACRVDGEWRVGIK